MENLEYRSLKLKGLIHFEDGKAIIDRGEIATIDKAALEADIKRRKLELEILTELLTDLP